MNGHQQLTSNVVGDYCDGTKYGTHRVFSVDHSSLQIFLYFDELEVCSPLASKRTKHKIGKRISIIDLFIFMTFTGAFYYTLGNLHPKYQQQLSNIQLLALVKSSVIKEYEMKTVLPHVIKDFNALQLV